VPCGTLDLDAAPAGFGHVADVTDRAQIDAALAPSGSTPLSRPQPGGRPAPVNVLGLFAQHPALARAFLGYSRHLTGPSSTVDRRTRELVVLRVAWRRRCRYE
jgi:alkylhydroperoxidase family enzyme